MREGDVLIVISASGNSPNIVKACEYAKEMKSKIILKFLDWKRSKTDHGKSKT
jgi:phosphoheptose isomerase